MVDIHRTSEHGSGGPEDWNPLQSRGRSGRDTKGGTETRVVGDGRGRDVGEVDEEPVAR